MIWLSEGDKKTKFFHLSTLNHRAKTHISHLKKGDLKITEEKDIMEEMVAFFSSLMTANPNINLDHQADFLRVIPPLVSKEHNKLLSSIPKDEEIFKAVCSLGGDKAPSPDGFPMFFFQKLWKLIGKDVCDAVKEFYGAKQMLKEINSTFLCLIPKNIGANSLDQFRLISLCNSLYKIISKVLTSRLLLVIPSIIVDQQNGFILGRQILNSVISVHQNIHSLSCSNNQGFIMKVDIAKAYDRVEWAFLSKILHAFGFDHKVVGDIYQLISTSSIAVLVNGSSSHFFNPTQGLRQGDPLSPILFVIMADFLGRYIGDLIQKGVIKGL